MKINAGAFEQNHKAPLSSRETPHPQTQISLFKKKSV